MPIRTQKLYEVTLEWFDKTEVLHGWGASGQAAAADAMNNAGYGGGALRALKSWNAKEVENENVRGERAS